MSSSSRLLGKRGQARLAALVVLACLLQWLAAWQAGADDLSIVTVVPPAADRQVTVIADVRPPAAKPLPATAFTVRSGGTTLPSGATPVVSDRLALGVVVDASSDGAGMLRQALGGATNFLLQLPQSARMTAVADSSPPSVLAPLAPGPKDVLGGLSQVQSAGQRSTAEALGLALRQLPESRLGPRVVVLITAASDAKTDPAALAQQFRQAGALLAVVTTNPDTSYWASVTGDSGGLLVAPQSGDLSSAFQTAADTLRSRYLVSFPAPAQLPGWVSVRVHTTKGTLSADAFINSSAPAPAAPATGHSSLLRLIAIAAAVVAIPIAAVLLLRARTAPSRSDTAGIRVRRPLPPRRARVEAAGEGPPVAAESELADVNGSTVMAGPPPRADEGHADGSQARRWAAEPPPVLVPRGERSAAENAARAEADSGRATGAQAPIRAEAPTEALVAEAAPVTAEEPGLTGAEAAPAEPVASEESVASAEPPVTEAALEAADAAPAPEEALPAEPAPAAVASTEAADEAAAADQAPGELVPAAPANQAPAEQAPPAAAAAVAEAPDEPPTEPIPVVAAALAEDAPPAAAAAVAEAPGEAPTERFPAVAAALAEDAAPAAASAAAAAAGAPAAALPAPAAAPAAPTATAAPAPAARTSTPDEDARAYAHLDAQAANAAAAVATGRLDRRRAVAKLALAAPGRVDLYDRLIESERRMSGSQLTTWSHTETALELLAAARQVASGDATLDGPGGVRVQQTVPPGGDPITRTVLRLTRNGRWVRDCQTPAELARHVDLATLRANVPANR